MEIVERVIRRADAEANLCTPLDPPSMPGLTRWGRTTRFLREELIPAGWSFDNPRNLARTVHPSGEIAIVATSGHAMTGRPEHAPHDQYPKATPPVEAVHAQRTARSGLRGFDLATDEESAGPPPQGRQTWCLLYHVAEEDSGLNCHFQMPIENGWITSWAERYHPAAPATGRCKNLTDMERPGPAQRS